MKVAVIYNKIEISDSDVINVFGMPTKERYDPRMVEMVASALEKGGHNVRTFEGNKAVIDELQHFMPRVVAGERPGMVFNMAYGIQGQSRYTHIPAMLEMLGIPYAGSGPAGHAVALDKVMAKIVFQRFQLPTPAFSLLSRADADVSGVPFPAIVKPKMEAVSSGLRVVNSQEELREAVAAIIEEFQQQALVEEFIPGREFAVGLLGNGPTLEALPIVEIDLGGDPNAFQSLDDKLKSPRGKICPADVPSEVADELCRLSRTAFEALGLLDFARVDFRMDAARGLHILEINSMASLTRTGSYVTAAEAAGMDFPALVNRILDVATLRYFGVAQPTPDQGQGRAAGKAQPLHVRVRGHLRGNLPTMLDWLEQMVAISSNAHNVEGVNTLGSWVSNRFENLGFRRQLIKRSEVGNIVYFSNHDEAENDVLLLGHLDTVYDFQSHVHWSEERGRVLGSGVAESKGGIAVILAALHALRSARALRSVRCGVLLTSDDTSGGRLSREIVREIALRSGWVLGTKYGELNGGIVTSCSGMLEYQIELTGAKGGHGRGKADVVTALAKTALALRRLGSAKEGVTVTLNQLTARKAPGRAADYAAATVTTRFVTTDQGQRLDSQVRKVVEKGTDGSLQAQVRPGAHRPPVVTTKVSQRLYERALKLAGKLEVRVEAVHRDWPAGICHVPHSVPVLGGLGPLGGEVRSPDEYILRDSLIERSALLAMMIHESRGRS